MVYRALIVAYSLFLLADPVQGHAQTALTTTRDDLENKFNFGARSAPDVSKPDIAVPVPAAEPSVPAEDGKAASFKLNTVTFKNADSYPAGALDDVWSDYAGQQVTLRELAIIANRTQDRYRRDGYLATRVLIKAQTVTDGKVELSVFEGRLADVTIIGDLDSRAEAVKQRLSILNNRPMALKVADLERALLLIRDIPGLNISARLVPTRTKLVGGLDLEVTVIDKRYSGFANLQNFSSEETGEFLSTAGLEFNGVFDPTDQVRVIGLAEPFDQEQLNGLLEYQIRPGNGNITLRTGVSYGINAPGGALAPLDLDGENLIAYGELEYPLIRSQQKNLFAVVGAEYSQQASESGSIEIIDDTVATVYGKFKGNIVSNLGIPSLPSGITAGTLEVRKGVGGSNSGDTNLSRIEGESEFTSVRGKLTHTQPLYADLVELYLDGRFQYSDSPLLAYEEMSLGGLTIGRGYDPGVLSGDDGYAGTVELRVRPPMFSNNIFQRTEFFGFYDRGVVSNQDSGSLSDQGISSIGGGVRFYAPQLADDTNIGGLLEVTYAKPLDPALSTSNDTPNSRFLINLSVFW